eukprot:COSAG01_NODE_2760_length_7120_cov_49.854253_9_plen_185_part_00
MIWHKADEVSWGFPSWKRSILAEIYLGRACSCHESEDGNARPGLPHAPRRDVFSPRAPRAQGLGRGLRLVRAACVHAPLAIGSSCLEVCTHCDPMAARGRRALRPPAIRRGLGGRRVFSVCQLEVGQLGGRRRRVSLECAGAPVPRVALFAELVKDGYNERAYLAEQASISATSLSGPLLKTCR